MRIRIPRLPGAGVAVLAALSLTPAMAAAAMPATTAPAATKPPTAATATAHPASPADLHPHVVATFPAGQSGAFAESLAVDRHGTLYVALTIWSAKGWNRGQVWKVTPDGRRTRFGPELSVGVLTGLAFDEHGRLYAGLAAWKDSSLPGLKPGVVRIDERTVTRVLTLPTGSQATASFPNGLAFHDGDLYVSDSNVGAVWRTHPHGDTDDSRTSPWLKNALFKPSTGELGINGIAFHGERLYAVVADSGVLVQVTVRHHGSPSTPRIVTRSAALKDADGVAFDNHGDLWVAANRGATAGAGALLRIGRDGKVTVIAEHPSWLDYPTQPAFGVTSHDQATLYISNGAFSSDGVSDVTAIQVDAQGVRLPA